MSNIRILRYVGCIYLSLLVTLLLSCSDNYDKYSTISDKYPAIFPDYVGVTIPINIAPLNFELEEAKRMRVKVFYGGDILFDIKTKSVAEFPKKKWTETLKQYAGKTVFMEVTAWTQSNPNGIRYKPFAIYISHDDIDPWIAYRLIPPGYESWKKMGIYQRNITNFDEEAIIKNAQNDGGCVNCHNFCNYDPNTWMFHARGNGGGTIITHNGMTRKVMMEQKGPHKGATYPAWHPSGHYIAFSSNITRQVFYGISRDKIEVFDHESDLLVYDVQNDKVLWDERFNEEANQETFPAFSPDGKYLYYCVGRLILPNKKQNNKPTIYESLKYALCRVTFDEATGTFGEQIDTIYSVYKRGGSVSFPRISPNGRYLLYTLADCATFPIQHVEADLKMIDLDTGNDMNTDILNSEYTDSYHSWSSNGKWIVFSSRRIDGQYTRLFFAHCDDNGHFTKPFLLPQRDPYHNTARLYSYNIPEFIKSKETMNKDKLAGFFK